MKNALGLMVGVVMGLLLIISIGHPKLEAKTSEDTTYSGVAQMTNNVGGDSNVVRFYDSELDVYCWKTGANQGGISCLPRGFVEQYKTAGN